MGSGRSIALFFAALIVACGVVALEWYGHVGQRGTKATVPLQAATPAPTAHTSILLPSQPPVVYVPAQPSASEQASPEASLAPTLAPRASLPPVVRESPAAPPRILAMSLSAPVVHGGEVVSGMVETSSNVASVEARIGGYAASMRKVGVGRFALSYRVPPVPFFLRRTYMVRIIARSAGGQAATSAVPITIR